METKGAAIEIKDAAMEDFGLAFDYIEKLWTYNTYNRKEIEAVYKRVLENPNDFAFFVYDGGEPMGFCHGTFFNTFWLSGQTCYVSSIISNEDARGKGYGIKLMDHAKELAEARGCRAIVLDSGMPRVNAHRFYEIYGFEKCGYCFELKLHG
ncbi:MAG: GNAT family N-acetyltransferase [Clostridiales Family XIII bacterium]|jgi:GNAT superfamily N-acetyltransferase|nr:GNAT family N-acetyltransferase [Clostridiales Family XIII bacterium]